MALNGKAVIGQSGGPTSVINQSLVGAILEARRHGAITGFYGARHGVKGVLGEDFVDLFAESEQNLSLVARSPSAALGSVRKKPTTEECHEIFRILRAHDVRYFFYIGGNDSAETASILHEVASVDGYDLRVFHIPKTIDNDLLVTDHCPGYGSAARFVALAFMGDTLDNRSLPGVKVNVVMGRHAGYLTAASAFGRRHVDDGPHLIYVPEIDFDMDKFLGDVENCLRRDPSCVIAVSEGISDKDGVPIKTSGGRDAHGNVQLSGTGALGDYLSQKIREKLKVGRVRADTFGYLQRCYPTIVSEVDSQEAREVGARAVRAAVTEEATSGSIAIRRGGDSETYTSELFITPLGTVAKETRDLDRRFIADTENDVTSEFIEYARPLIGELPPVGRLAGKPIARKLEA